MAQAGAESFRRRLARSPVIEIVGDISAGTVCAPPEVLALTSGLSSLLTLPVRERAILTSALHGFWYYCSLTVLSPRSMTAALLWLLL